MVVGALVVVGAVRRKGAGVGVAVRAGASSR